MHSRGLQSNLHAKSQLEQAYGDPLGQEALQLRNLQQGFLHSLQLTVAHEDAQEPAEGGAKGRAAKSTSAASAARGTPNYQATANLLDLGSLDGVPSYATHAVNAAIIDSIHTETDGSQPK